MLEMQLQKLTESSQNTISELRAEVVLGTNNLQQKADQINLIEAEFRLAKKWISAMPTFRADLELAKDELKRLKNKMVLRKKQCDKEQERLRKVTCVGQSLSSATTIVTQELEHDAPNLELQKFANTMLTKCTPSGSNIAALSWPLMFFAGFNSAKCLRIGPLNPKETSKGELGGHKNN